MHMNRIKTLIVATLCIGYLETGITWGADRPYTEGSVWSVTFVRVKPGMDGAYL